MQRLSPNQPERGAVAIVIALFLVALIGLGALVVDFGALVQEQSELQNGADAAALALATDCIQHGDCADNAATQDEAEWYASQNSSDGFATVVEIVFDDPLLTEHPDKNVTVKIGTNDFHDGGDAEIEFALAPVVGFGSASLTAEATVAWGVPIELPILPIGIGLCSWDEYTNSGDDFPSDPELFLLRPAVSLPLAPPVLCPDSPDNQGGFGFLAIDGDCEADIVDGYVQGQIIPVDPLDVLGCEEDDLLEEHLYIPIFDAIDDATSPNPPCDSALQECYRVYGYAVFEISPTGLDLGGLAPSITGSFVDIVLLDYAGDVDPDLPDLGLNTIRIAS